MTSEPRVISVRMMSSIGYTPPVEFEAAYYRQKDGLDKAA